MSKEYYLALGSKHSLKTVLKSWWSPKWAFVHNRYVLSPEKILMYSVAMKAPSLIQTLP
jgi:hypothetical protein